MKNKFVLCTTIFFSCIYLVTAGYSQKKIDVSYQKESIENVLTDLTEKFNVDIFYNDQQVKKLSPFTYRQQQADLFEVLNKCLEESGLSYQKVGKVLVITNRKQELSQQNLKKRITGRITDQQKNPLSGVNIVIIPRMLGFITNNKGEFSIDVLPGDSSIQMSHVGMQPKEVLLVAGKTHYEIILQEELYDLNEVIITGYGEVNKKNFTGTSTKVSGEELMKASPNNLIQSLALFDPSFRLVENNAMGSDPNTMPEFYIRGRSGIGNTQLSSDGELLSESDLRNNPNQPTFILDGYEVNLQTVFDLDPSMVKSVSILKDAASTAIYGSRASNGVVVIESKQPEGGKLRVNYSLTGGISTPDLSAYNLTNAREKLEVELLSGLYTPNPDEVENEQMKTQLPYYQKLAQINKGVETDWLAQAVETAISHKHTANISGGEKHMLYAINVVSDHTNGVMKKSKRRRNSINVSLSYRMNKLQFRNHIEWQNVKSDDSPYGDFGIYATRNPYDSFLDDDGHYKQVLSEDWNIGKSFNQNPLYDATLASYRTTKNNNISNNFSLKWLINDHLRLETRIALRYSHTAGKRFVDPASSGFTDKPIDEKGSLSISDNTNFAWDANAFLSYNKSFEKHHVNATLGSNMQETQTQTSTYAYQGFPSGTVSDLVFAAKLLSNPTGGSNTSRLMGFFGQINYTWNNIYLLDVSARFDGASQFGENNQFAPFWSLGTGINIHNYQKLQEKFPWLDNLKLRATYGILGNAGMNQNVSEMMYSYNKSQWYIDGMGAVIQVLGNQDLKWERSANFDFGLDIGMFQRFSISLGYYKKITNDLIGDITIPSSTGFTSYKNNLGKVVNKGYEAMLRVGLIKNKDFTFNFYGSVAHNSNTIEEISDALKDYNKKVDQFYNDNRAYYNPLMRYYPGASLTAIYAMPSLGINPVDGQEIFVNKDGTTTYTWNPAQHIVVGDTESDVSGTFGINVDYKGVFLYTAFSYAFGGEMMNSTLYSKVENANVYGNVDRRVFTDRWKQPGDESMYKSIQSGAYTRATSRFVQKNNYIAFNSISLGYHFSAERLKKLHISRLKCQLSMNELGRISSIATERGTSYPFARTVNFSIHVGL